MNSISLKQNQVCQRFHILTKVRFFVHKNFSKDREDDSTKEEEARTVQKGILHDKQQSVKEESYFHKEGKEQLELLKQKLKKPKSQKSEHSDADDKN